jgi:arabinan endo-1,5-alpha-L-arabinosidase
MTGMSSSRLAPHIVTSVRERVNGSVGRRRAMAVACGIALAFSACGHSSDKPSAPQATSSPSSRPPLPVVATNGAALNRDFPDPDVIRVSDGTYYAYATQTITGTNTVNIQVARSRNLKAWVYLGDALPDKSPWAKTTQSFWAPQVVERGDTFYMYYASVPDDATGDENCLAVATSKTPAGPFTDVGKPLFCGYEIDPDVFHDPKSGRWFMYWGSAGDIAVQQMTNDLLHLKGPSQSTALLGWASPVHRPYEHGIEGPFVIHKGGWYYLFYSGDNCCSLPPHYALMVARSHRPEGPFERLGTAEHKPSSVILSDWGRWLGPGHCSVLRDANGRWWVAYHAIDKRHPKLPSGDVRRVMLIDRLDFKNGWPVVNTNITPVG